MRIGNALGDQPEKPAKCGKRAPAKVQGLMIANSADPTEGSRVKRISFRLRELQQRL